MAGFTSRAKDLVDLQVVPYPAVTLVIDLGDGMLVDHASGQQQLGSLAVGLAPSGVRGRGRHIECLQVRLSPVVAHAVLGASSELGGTVIAICNRADSEVRRSCDLVFELEADVREVALLAPFVVPVQLMGFHTGVKKGLTPDNPRNLSRVVLLD